jgi:Rrf2 family protein
LGLKRGVDMRLSTKGRYGLMAMSQLALEDGSGPISLKYIAEKQNLSESYLEQLFSTLRKNGLLESVRGSQGGYMLTRKPADITVGQILRALEGELGPAECVHDTISECTKEDGCATKLVLIKIKDSIDEVIDSITLEDMVNDVKKMKMKL